MEIAEILRHVDHTVLAQQTTWADICTVCDDGVRFGVASVCIPPSYVKDAAAYLAGRLPVCTVIGFPNGYSTTAAKCFEAQEAVENGASEIDMVINLGWVKDQRWEDLSREIRQVKDACAGKILKVIVETCFLSEEEKLRLCALVGASGGDYIKTSTGFASGGANLQDIALFRAHAPAGLKIKASGGIQGLEDAAAFLAAGADRLGTSRIVRAVKAMTPPLS